MRWRKSLIVVLTVLACGLSAGCEFLVPFETVPGGTTTGGAGGTSASTGGSNSGRRRHDDIRLRSGDVPGPGGRVPDRRLRRERQLR